jgi:hypothetical protein
MTTEDASATPKIPLWTLFLVIVLTMGWGYYCDFEDGWFATHPTAVRPWSKHGSQLMQKMLGACDAK